MHRLSRTYVALLIPSCFVVVILVAWRHDHTSLVSQLTQHSADGHNATHDADEFTALLDALQLGGGLKPDYWRVSDYLGLSTDALEHELGLSGVEGVLVTSRGFGGDVQLRQPTDRTFRVVAAFLASNDTAERARATKLLALYGESYRASPVDPYEDPVFSSRGRFSWANEPVPVLVELLKDPDVHVRQGAALALAHLSSAHQSARPLSQAFAQESDDTTRVYIGWALDRLMRPRPLRTVKNATP